MYPFFPIAGNRGIIIGIAVGQSFRSGGGTSDALEGKKKKVVVGG